MRKKLFLMSLLACLMVLFSCEPKFDVDNTTPVSPQNRVIYEMNVGSFTPEGTFAAAQARLDTLHQLGIDIVWLMPIYPRGAIKNSPYASMDYKAVNPKYGTVEDVKNFINRAHELGMEVWLDWVPNHVASENPWTQSHPEYFTKNEKGEMIHPHGWEDVYELNYQDPGLVNEMNSAMKFWLDNGADGFRCDYVTSPTIPAKYWIDVIKELKAYKPGKSVTFLTETDISDPNPDNARIDSCGFDYDYAWGFQGLLAYKFGKEGNVADSLQALCQKYIDDSQRIKNRRMIYLTNHDQNYNDGGHTLKDFYGDNRYCLTVLEFTLYGMPLLYNGQEIGDNDTLSYFTDGKVQWNKVDYKMKHTVRTLIALRHTQASLADAAPVEFLKTDNAGVMAYRRGNVVVLLNLGTAEANVKVAKLEAGDYKQWLNSTTIAKGPQATDVKLDPAQPVKLEAKGYEVYVKK